MGVRNIYGFVEDNEKLLTKQVELSNTHLVIDGRALQRILFDRSTINKSDALYGGNYVAYAKTLEEFFGRLSDCKIKPYVILSGAKDPRMESSESARDYYVEKMNSKNFLYEIQPIMNNYVLMDVLTKLGVRHGRTLFDAGSDLVAIANEVKCPLMSDNTDLYMFDIPGGFIHANKLVYNPDRVVNDGSGIQATVYYRSILIEHFPGISTHSLALFSCIIGNARRRRQFGSSDPCLDIVRTFEKVDPGDFTCVQGINYRILQVLKWLVGKEPVEATAEFAKLMSEKLREHFNEAVVATNDFYELKTAQSCFIDHVEELGCFDDHSFTHNEKKFGDKLVRQVMDSRLSASTVTMYLQNDVYILPQADDFEQGSSFTVALDLTKNFLSMLRTTDDISASDTKKIHDWAIDPESKYMSRLTIEAPIKTVSETGVGLPKINELEQLLPQQKQQLIINLLGVWSSDFEGIKKIVTSLPTKFLSDSDLEAVVILVCILKHALSKVAADKQKLFKKFATNQLITSVYHLTNIAILIPAADIMANLERREGPINRQIVHCYTQLQAVTRMFMQINGLLDHPFEKLPLSRMFDGVLTHNLVLHGPLKGKPKELADLF